MTKRSAVHSTFVVERMLNATPARVFTAFSTEEGKQRWFGDSAWKPLERTFDFRVGGTESLEGEWQNGMISRFDARYFDIVENERLVYTYDMHIDGNKISVSLATIELKADGAKTRLTLTEQGVYLDGYDDAGKREHGTNVLMDRLVAAFSDATVKA